MFCRTLALVILATASAKAVPSLADAIALVEAKRFPEARQELEQIVASDPKNAAAWYQLGMVWDRRTDEEALRQAIQCLARAVEIEPGNSNFVGEYGGALLELADRTRSISAARNGREAMEKAVALNPDNLDAREGLFQFYTQAPFFVGGSSSRAAAELEEISKRDSDRGVALAVLTKANAKDFAGAFQLCEEALKRNPDNYTALYQYGRTASFSGQNLARGLECLHRSLKLEPPSAASPTHSNVWYRIGDLQTKLGHAAEAHEAFAEALKLDPNNRQAAAAIERFDKTAR